MGAVGALLALVLALWGAPDLRAQSRPDTGAGRSGNPGAEVIRLFNLLVSAANRLDVDAENEFYWRSPDLVSVAQGTPTRGWDARAQNTRQWYGALARQKIRVEDVETRPLGGDAVALLATYHQEIAAKDGRTWKGSGVWSLIFRRVEGAWRVVYEHYSYEE